jgi:2-aminoadipate transaminase
MTTHAGAAAFSVRPERFFSRRAQVVLPDPYAFEREDDPELISLAYGYADPRLFPREELVEAMAVVVAEDAAEALNYAPSYPGLEAYLAERMRRKGIDMSQREVIVTYGSSQVIGLLPFACVDPGDVVIIEGPTFLGAVRQFQEGGAVIESVPLDAQGMDLDALEATLQRLERQGQRARFIYTIPTFQNPAGVTMPVARRRRLLELASQYDTLIIEDDAYGDLRFEGEHLPPIAALDTEGRVLYVGTFSKILAPGVRCGWGIGHPEIIERLRMLKVEGSSGPLMTRVIERYCREDRLDRHIAELTTLYHRKRDVMLAAIAREFPAGYSFEHPEGGFFIWCRLPAGLSARVLAQAAADEHLQVLPGTACFADGQGDNYIRLSFSYQPEELIDRGITRLAAVMRQMLG